MKNKRKRKSVGRAVRGAQRPRRGRPDPEADDAPQTEKVLRGRDNRELPPDEASATERGGDVRDGRVVSIRGTQISVEPLADPDETAAGDAPAPAEPVPTVLRKSTRVPHPEASAVAIGDRVRYLAEGEPPFVLTEIQPRRTHLTRVRRGHEQHVIAANLDLGVMVASAVDPPFKPRLVDRYLISFAEGGLEPVLVLNKIDLLEDVEPRELLAAYDPLPLPALAVSAATGDGLPALREVLAGRTAVFAGQSGVGKSSLLNRLGGLDLRTNTIQESTGKGRHTTTHSTLYHFPFGGSVVDTPGVRSFQVHEPSPESLEAFFPEVIEAASHCRFRDCSHGGEAGCALPEAVEGGRVRPERLESFRILLDEVRGA